MLIDHQHIKCLKRANEVAQWYDQHIDKAQWNTDSWQLIRRDCNQRDPPVDQFNPSLSGNLVVIPTQHPKHGWNKEPKLYIILGIFACELSCGYEHTYNHSTFWTLSLLAYPQPGVHLGSVSELPAQSRSSGMMQFAVRLVIKAWDELDRLIRRNMRWWGSRGYVPSAEICWMVWLVAGWYLIIVVCYKLVWYMMGNQICI